MVTTAYERMRKYRARVPNQGKRIPWKVHEVQEIMAEDRPNDVDLAQKLGRSLPSIQTMRYRVKRSGWNAT